MAPISTVDVGVKLLNSLAYQTLQRFVERGSEFGVGTLIQTARFQILLIFFTADPNVTSSLDDLPYINSNFV